jgi:thiamine-phosphate pyrophosphorylase
MNRPEWLERLNGSHLYVVTGARRDRGDLKPFLDAILSAGVDIVQLREKEAEGGDLLRWGEVFRDAAGRHGALFIVNDRPDVALAAGADGVHLGQNDLPAAVARKILGPDAIIGLSTHGPEQLRPWFAIGGIDPTNLSEVLDAGATRIVVVRAVSGSDAPGPAARELARRLLSEATS